LTTVLLGSIKEHCTSRIPYLK